MSKYFSVLRINWIHSLEYRANAIIGLFAIFSGLFIEYQIWSLIFENSNYTKIPFQGSDKDFTFIQLIVVILFPNIIFNTLVSILGFIISLLVSIYISYCIYFIMVCFAFWFGEVRSIVTAYNLGMLMISGQYIPIRLFPEKALAVIDWTPLRYLVDFPVSTAFGLFSLNEWLYNFLFSILWCVILTFTCFVIYKKGVSKYEAYGQ